MSNDLLRMTAMVTAVLAGALVVWIASRLWTRYRATRLPLFVLPVALGAFFAYEALSEPNAYVASFVFGEPWVISGVIALGSLPLLARRTTRRASFLGLTAAALLLATFYLLIATAYASGFRWQENPLVPLR